MVFNFDEAEINYIYTKLRSFPLVFNEVQPILAKIETQFKEAKEIKTDNE